MRDRDPREGSRPPFSETSVEDQLQRFSAIREYARGVFDDFWRNVYKYPDRFSIVGKDAKEVARLLEEGRMIALNLNNLLNVFKEDKLVATGESNEQIRGLAISELVDGVPIILQNRTADSARMQQMYRWTIDTFQAGGEKIGRIPDKSETDVDLMKEDLDVIIAKVASLLNQYEAQQRTT